MKKTYHESSGYDTSDQKSCDDSEADESRGSERIQLAQANGRHGRKRNRSCDR